MLHAPAKAAVVVAATVAVAEEATRWVETLAPLARCVASRRAPRPARCCGAPSRRPLVVDSLFCPRHGQVSQRGEGGAFEFCFFVCRSAGPLSLSTFSRPRQRVDAANHISGQASWYLLVFFLFHCWGYTCTSRRKIDFPNT